MLAFKASEPALLEEVLAKYQYMNLTGDVGDVKIDVQLTDVNAIHYDIFRGTLSSTGEQLAVQRYRFFRIHSNVQNYFQGFTKMFSTWARFHHENVDRLIGYIIEDTYPSLVTKWHANGDVLAYLRKPPARNLSELVEYCYYKSPHYD